MVCSSPAHAVGVAVDLPAVCFPKPFTPTVNSSLATSTPRHGFGTGYICVAAFTPSIAVS